MGVPPNHPFLFGIFHYKPYDGENWIDMEEWRIYDIGYIYTDLYGRIIGLKQHMIVEIRTKDVGI